VAVTEKRVGGIEDAIAIREEDCTVEWRRPPGFVVISMTPVQKGGVLYLDEKRSGLIRIDAIEFFGGRGARILETVYHYDRLSLDRRQLRKPALEADAENHPGHRQAPARPSCFRVVAAPPAVGV